MTELVIYIIIAIIWGIISLIQKALKPNKSIKGSKKNKTAAPQNNKKYSKKSSTTISEEDIFKKLQKNIEDLQNYSDETLNKYNRRNAEYETSSSDREMLELQEKYNSRIKEIDDIKNSSNNYEYNNIQENKRHVSNMLTSLDIKNAIIYNAILEPKRINYRMIKNKKVN